MENEIDEFDGQFGIQHRFPKSNYQFFPTNVFGDDHLMHRINERIYASYFDSLQEQPWYPPQMAEPERYRLLYLPTFAGAEVIRLTRFKDSWQAVHKRCNGDAGYGPGKLISESSQTLSHRKSRQFTSQLEAAHFWDMSTYEESCCLDGWHVVLEGIQEGTYHVVDRCCPKNCPYSDLTEFLLSIPCSWLSDMFRRWFNL